MLTTEGSTRARTDFTSPIRGKTLVFGENRTVVVSWAWIAATTAKPTPTAVPAPTTAAMSTTAIQPRSHLPPS
jgi:hypothetical protein